MDKLKPGQKILITKSTSEFFGDPEFELIKGNIYTVKSITGKWSTPKSILFYFIEIKGNYFVEQIEDKYLIANDNKLFKILYKK
jgi:hypothetical protein